mgnify:FL=1
MDGGIDVGPASFHLDVAYGEIGVQLVEEVGCCLVGFCGGPPHTVGFFLVFEDVWPHISPAEDVE